MLTICYQFSLDFQSRPVTLHLHSHPLTPNPYLTSPQVPFHHWSHLCAFEHSGSISSLRLLLCAFPTSHAYCNSCPYHISELLVYLSVSLNKTVNSLRIETVSHPALYLELEAKHNIWPCAQ